MMGEVATGQHGVPHDECEHRGERSTANHQGYYIPFRCAVAESGYCCHRNYESGDDWLYPKASCVDYQRAEKDAALAKLESLRTVAGRMAEELDEMPVLCGYGEYIGARDCHACDNNGCEAKTALAAWRKWQEGER